MKVGWWRSKNRYILAMTSVKLQVEINPARPATVIKGE